MSWEKYDQCLTEQKDRKHKVHQCGQQREPSQYPHLWHLTWPTTRSNDLIFSSLCFDFDIGKHRRTNYSAIVQHAALKRKQFSSSRSFLFFSFFLNMRYRSDYNRVHGINSGFLSFSVDDHQLSQTKPWFLVALECFAAKRWAFLLFLSLPYGLFRW